MSEYLQDRFSEASHTQFKEQITNYLHRANTDVWLIGDGSFDDAPLVSGGALDWQPVFTTEPMNQYDEMGLFMARLHLDNYGLIRAVNQLERFSGLPMFSYIVTQRSEKDVAQLLTWLSDAHTDDGLSLYLRIGDTRCLAYILETVNSTQYDYITSVVDAWGWFGRDALWNQCKSMLNARAHLPQQYTPPSEPNVIDAIQFDQLIEGGEVDLIYSAIQNNDVLFKRITSIGERYTRLHHFIAELKKQGITDVNIIKQNVYQSLSSFNDGN